MILADREDLDHMRILNRRRDARFLLQLGVEGNVVSEFPAQQLERDEAIEPGIARFVNRAHSTDPKRLDDFVLAKNALDPELKSAGRTSDFREGLQTSGLDRPAAAGARLHLHAVGGGHRRHTNTQK